MAATYLGQLKAELRARGINRTDLDLLIAASALRAHRVFRIAPKACQSLFQRGGILFLWCSHGRRCLC